MKLYIKMFTRVLGLASRFLFRFITLSFACLIAFSGVSFGAEKEVATHHVKDWKLGFQEQVTEVGSQVAAFHSGLLILITVISLLVLGLIAYVCFRFNEKRNPVPATFTHNVKLEIVWTAIPILIVVVMSFFSIKALYFATKIPNPELTVKVIGKQWYWTYIYPDNKDITFDSYMLKADELKPGQKRLLDVDNELVLPTNTNIKLLITAADVIHSWAMPAFGVKMDAVPGRTNETWFNIKKEGTYYGQCSELCGQGHGFMPIKVRAVSKEEFNSWTTQKQLT